tara:strand:- start:1007 stop:1537 length:531 start_codon:yes stop_codon:yes gene_type:complete
MIVPIASSLLSYGTLLLLPSDNPREMSLVQNTAWYLTAICFAPWIFNQLGGETIGATFTMIVLFLHMMALTGKDEAAVATKNAMDMKNSANSLIAGVMTYAFLIAAINNKKEYYSTTSASAKAWMISLLGAVLFMLPDIPFSAESYPAYYVRQLQYIMMSFVLGFFVSGIVLSRKK